MVDRNSLTWHRAQHAWEAASTYSLDDITSPDDDAATRADGLIDERRDVEVLDAVGTSWDEMGQMGQMGQDAEEAA